MQMEPHWTRIHCWQMFECLQIYGSEWILNEVLDKVKYLACAKSYHTLGDIWSLLLCKWFMTPQTHEAQYIKLRLTQISSSSSIKLYIFLKQRFGDLILEIWQLYSTWIIAVLHATSCFVRPYHNRTRLYLSITSKYLEKSLEFIMIQLQLVSSPIYCCCCDWWPPGGPWRWPLPCQMLPCWDHH